MKAISVRQPWAWLLIHGAKDIENRDWRYAPSYRGEIAIQAAKGMTYDEYIDAVTFVRTFEPKLAACIPNPHELARGAVIGTMILRDCVTDSPSPWFQGPLGLVMDTPQPCDPIPARGMLGLFDWTPPKKGGE